ncbi:scavenger receptor class B member 1 [Trichonephila inaurata madagascariensis]|uniref:Scavenger receptor class B member 1 n=1 Tax=Trichonephila inaurata madagascariensis TaxID=2747483 RepID=A0A8X7CL78_9ARAC|nr:scavenger receptor class B member 1 [Trichonephila inaurata madagascariensis]
MNLRSPWSVLSRCLLLPYRLLITSFRGICTGTPYSIPSSGSIRVKMRCGRKFLYAALGVSTVLAVGTIIAFCVFPGIFHKELMKQTTLEENTLLFNLWKDLPMPVYQKIYFFNITNQERYLKGLDAYPRFEEVGPYTYLSTWKKEEIVFGNGSVSYREVKTYHFDPDKSNGTEEDIVYSLSAPYASATNFMRTKGVIFQKLANAEFNFMYQTLIHKKTIAELTYKGYFDTILYTTQTFYKTPYHDSNFAWFYHKNNTDEGKFTVDTGKYDHSQVNIIKTWKGQTKLNYWKGDTCNVLNCTNGEVGPPLTEGQTKYTFFQPLACRTFTFEYEGDHNIFGTKVKRFQNTRRLFGNLKDNPDNYCYVKDEDLPTGVLDISACQFNAPVYLSFPHFYLADTSYLYKMDGLSPIEELHKSYVDVNPITGVTLRLAIRVQVNLRIHKMETFSHIQNMTSGIYPVFWVELGAEVGEELSDYLKKETELPQKIAYTILGICLVASLMGFLLSLVFLVRTRKRMWDEIQPLVGDTRNITYSSIVPIMEPIEGSSTRYSSVTKQVSHNISREESHISGIVDDPYVKTLSFQSSGRVDRSSKIEIPGSISPQIIMKKADSPSPKNFDLKRDV